MTRRLYPARLTGTVAAPPSKSAWHRELICRFLAGQPLPQELSGADVSATLSGLRVLRQAATPSTAARPARRCGFCCRWRWRWDAPDCILPEHPGYWSGPCPRPIP